MIGRRGFFASMAIAAAAFVGVRITKAPRRFSFPVDSAMLNDIALYTSREIARRLPNQGSPKVASGRSVGCFCAQGRYTWDEFTTQVLNPFAECFARGAGKDAQFYDVPLRSTRPWARVLATDGTVPLLVEGDGDLLTFHLGIDGSGGALR